MTVLKKAENVAGGGTTPTDRTTLYAQDWNNLVIKANQFSPLEFWRNVLVYAGFVTQTSSDNYAWNGIAWAPALGLFCAVATSGTGERVMTSPDGITWTTRTTPADNAWTFVTWSPELNLFCAVARSGTGNRVMTSPDGITWTTRASSANLLWLGITWAPALGLFCAVAISGSGNRVATSRIISTS